MVGSLLSTQKLSVASPLPNKQNMYDNTRFDSKMFLGASWLPLGVSWLLDAYWVFTAQEDVHAFLLDRRTCLLVEQEDIVQQGEMSSCSIRRLVFWSNKKTCLLVLQKDVSSCSTRRRVFLSHRRACLLVEQEDTFSCSAGRHVFLSCRKTCLLVE